MKERESWKKGLRCAPAISTSYGSTDTAGRHGAAARCFSPTAWGFARFAIGSKNTPREAGIRCCNRRRCWKNLLRKTEALVLLPRKGWQHEHASVSLGEILPSGLDWGTPIRTSSIPEFCEVAVERFGARPAIEFNDVEIRYTEIKEQVARAAAGLAAMGVGPGVSVALYLPNVPYHPISFFAVLHAGGRVVHLSPLDAPRMLRFKLEDSEARIL